MDAKQNQCAVLTSLLERFPELCSQKNNIVSAFDIFKSVFDSGGILFICGNGGSSADAEHIVGELMKSFLLPRPVTSELRRRLEDDYGADGQFIADRLQRGLPTVSLNSHGSLTTAFANDVDGSLVYAQQLHVLAGERDGLLAISTSGHSDNVVKCLRLARSMKLRRVALTGRTGGACRDLADCSIEVPADETHIVQEYHQPVYHALCAMLEEHYYG